MILWDMVCERNDLRTNVRAGKSKKQLSGGVLHIAAVMGYESKTVLVYDCIS
jgi:hypothetical protein